MWNWQLHLAACSKMWRRVDWMLIEPLLYFSVQQFCTRDLSNCMHCCYFQQEGQHPLTGLRAANFRLLANQWAERRLVTQWRNGCRAMRRSVCNSGAFNGGRSICVQISRERSYPLPIPLDMQLIALQPCRGQFLYNETLQQTCRPLLSKLSERRQI